MYGATLVFLTVVPIVVMIVITVVIMVMVVIFVAVSMSVVTVFILVMPVLRDVFVVVPLVAHKVDRAAAGVILGAMFVPVLLVSGGDVQINRRG